MKRTQWLGTGFLVLALIACGNDTGDSGPIAGSGPDPVTDSHSDSDSDSVADTDTGSDSDSDADSDSDSDTDSDSVTGTGSEADAPREPVSACSLSEGDADPACGDHPDGRVCVELDTAALFCGCVDDDHCPAPLNCDLEARRCTDEEVPESCALESDECAGDPRGELCLESDDSPYNRCGCVSDDDCAQGGCSIAQRECM